MKRVVVIGGGSGLATLLRGLRRYPLDITAIVTMTDDGASSGRLRRDFNLLPPGDIRKCIAALSENETALTELFQYRFKHGLGLSGHSLGNLLIMAMKDMTGNFELAIEEISSLLNIRGTVLPATLEDVNLVADFGGGKKVIGESNITKYGYSHKIHKVALTKRVKTNPKAIEAIKNADLVIVGPGSLYTSIIPNFLQRKLRESVVESGIPKLYICNVSTERGETAEFTLSDHVRELTKYCCRPEMVLANSKPMVAGARDKHVVPVSNDANGVEADAVILADVVREDNPLYHDSGKLAAVVWEILSKPRKFTKRTISGKIIEL